jgi:glycosyltransferase involved in cell wall biosynthesis
MRIILLVPTLEIGGTERQVLILCGRLKESGHNFELLALEGGNMYEDFLSTGITPRVFLVKGARKFSKFFAIFRLLFYLVRTKTVILDTYLPQSAILGLIVKSLRPKDFFLIVNRRSQIIYRRHRSISAFLDKLASRNADQLTVNSRQGIEEYSIKDGVPVANIIYVPNFLSPNEPNYDISYDTGNNETTIYCVANHSPIKGIGYLLEAFIKINQSKHPSRLVLIGRGVETKKLRQVANKHSPERIQFFENLSVNEIHFLNNSIFVLPSLSEGTSNALMEAMVSGLACIATSVGGSPDLLSGCGILVPPANSDELKIAIEDFIANPEKRREYGIRARERIIESQKKENPLRIRLELYKEASSILQD